MANQDIKQIAAGWKHTKYKYGGDSRTGIDCSHFVWEVIKASGHSQAKYLTTSEIGSSAEWQVEDIPTAGDAVVWDGHMGIIVDTTTGTFVGAQSHGVDEASYTSGYWGSQHHRYYRYVGH